MASRLQIVMIPKKDRSWLFNGSVENEAKLKPLCQEVEAQFHFPARRLCRYFATTEDAWLRQLIGKNFRGVHIPYSGRQVSPELQRHFFHEVGLSTNLTFKDTIAFDNLIYIRPGTCADKTGFVTTYAHELQHFVQHGTTPRLWAANNVLYGDLKRLEPSSIATDVPSEREANIVSKRVAEIVCGVEEVKKFAEERVNFMSQSGEYDERARWVFFRDVPSSIEYDYLADTRRLVEKYKTVLDFGIDMNEPEWWVRADLKSGAGESMSRKIDLAKVLASLNTLCPKCGYSIPSKDIQRVSFTEMRCPKCQAVFVAGAPIKE